MVGEGSGEDPVGTLVGVLEDPAHPLVAPYRYLEVPDPPTWYLTGTRRYRAPP